MNHPILSVTPRSVDSVPASRIGRMLVEQGKLTPPQAERAAQLQKEQNLLFGEAARRLDFVTEADIQQVLARQFDYSYLQPGDGRFPPELVTAYQPFSREAEMLRAVRGQLMLRWFDSGRKSLAVVSINPGDGTSLFIANLAVLFAQQGKQTLLLDANLRRGRQHRIFGIDDGQGLADILAGRAGTETIAGIDSFPNLSVLPSGTRAPNPAELVGHSAFRALHDNLSNVFDVVLVDAPAFASAADAMAIAARVGGVLLVVRKDATRMEDVRAVSAQLAAAGVSVVGSVLVEF